MSIDLKGSEEYAANFMLDMFTRKLADDLVARAIEHIMPSIVEAADQVVKDMQPSIRKYFDRVEGNIIMQIIMKNPNGS